MGGNFTRGDTNDTHTVTVTNVGNAVTVGTVSGVDALPAGLTAASGPSGSLKTLFAKNSCPDPLARRNLSLSCREAQEASLGLGTTKNLF